MMNRTKIKVACMDKNLPWTDHKDINILTPCILCMNESVSVTGEKYCLECYKELLTNIIFNRKEE